MLHLSLGYCNSCALEYRLWRDSSGQARTTLERTLFRQIQPRVRRVPYWWDEQLSQRADAER